MLNTSPDLVCKNFLLGLQLGDLYTRGLVFGKTFGLAVTCVWENLVFCI